MHTTIEPRPIGSKQVDKLEDLIFGKMKDFFVSYTKADQPWAEWIAWKLEEAGYSTVIQAWDFHPGANFVLEMQQAASTADRTIAVLSQKYLESSFTASEWAAAFAQDPQGRKQKLIPIRIAPCELTGILVPINYLDLVGLPEADASAALLGAFSARNKPSSAPAFPGATTPLGPSVTPSRPGYPGRSQTTSPSLAESLVSLVESAEQNRKEARLSIAQRLQLVRQLNTLLPQHFNALLFAVKAEPELIPPMPALQADRTSALLAWAEGPTGCGLSLIQEANESHPGPQVGPSHSTTAPSAAGHSIPANNVSSPAPSDLSIPLGESPDQQNTRLAGQQKTRRVVAIMHGIRDEGQWMKPLQHLIEKETSKSSGA